MTLTPTREVATMSELVVAKGGHRVSVCIPARDEAETVDAVVALRAAVGSTTGDVLVFGDGYGIEIGLLIDVLQRHGRSAIVEVDLHERAHRNRPLHDLRPHADDVLAAVLSRLDAVPLPRRDPRRSP
jgi:glucosyl-3-phosphoglycerate synthase